MRDGLRAGHSYEIEAAGQRRAGATWFARSLRAGQTDAERVIWSELRGRRLNGHKFVRQFPIRA